MAQQTINVGTAPNDGTGTPLRTAFQYTNSNFSELYTAVGPSGNNIVVPGSATITGDLTVATNGLKVDSANKNVGINTASPTNTAGYKTLEIVGTGVNTGGMLRFKSSDTSVNTLDFADSNGRAIFAISNHPVRFGCNDIEQYRINPLGVFTWYDGAGGTRMTLNSTGLLVGTTATSYGAAGRGLVVAGGSTSAIIGMRVGSTDTGYIFADATKVELGGNGAVPIVINNGGAAITIDTARNVGIGVTPNDKLTVISDNYLSFQTAVTTLNSGRVGRIGSISVGTGNGSLVFETYKGGSGGGERMRIDSDGNLLVGTTSAGGNRLNVQTASGDCTTLIKSQAANVNLAIDYVSNYGNHTIRKSGTAVWDFGVINDASATPAFKVSNASSVGVQLVSGATSWTTLSDETMKDIIEPIINAVAKVGSLRSVIGKFKTDESSKRRSFLIAQDVQSVLPEAVDVIGENNELGLRYTEVIPLLVAAIKELTDRVQTLETR